MKSVRKRRIYFVYNALERHYLRLIFIAAAVPTLIVGGCLYYLIFTIMAEHIGIPEFVAEVLLPVVDRVNFLLVILIPAAILVLLVIGLVLTHSLTGPIERIKIELDNIIAGDISHRIKVRRSDRLKPLVDNINTLLEKVEKKL